MRVSSSNYPVDLLVCIVWSVLSVPVALFSMDTTVRTILGLPFLLFIPGYILVFALFPAKKTDRGIDGLERVALSFGLSIALVPLLGLILNYTPWGIRLEPILLSLFIFDVGVGAVAFFRWFLTVPEERFIVSFQFSFPKSTSRLDIALTIILAFCILIAVAGLIYVIITPKTGERFTEFYLLGPTGKATGYPRDLTAGTNASVIIGLTNHECRTVNYTIEIWLVNQTTIFNTSSQKNETVYHHLWFMKKILVSLNHTPIDTEKPWERQWEYNYIFTINRIGEFKLAFLLFTIPTEEYTYDTDYNGIVVEKMNSAYRELHLWLSVR